MDGAFMTDHQFDALLEMVVYILDGCKSVKEAQQKLRSIRSKPGQFPENAPSVAEDDRSNQAE